MVAYSASPFKRACPRSEWVCRPRAREREAHGEVCSLPDSAPEDAKILDSMDQALRAPRPRTVARLGTLLVGSLAFFLGLGRATAQLPMDREGLRGGRHVGSAAAVESAPRAMLGLGYAYTESVLAAGDDKHQRVFGEVAAAWAPRSWLQLSLGFDARYDTHKNPSDSGTALGTRLATRHVYALNERFAIGARTALPFPPASEISRGFKAVSPEFGAIASYLLRPEQELTVNIGYRIDRSDNTVRDPFALRPGDRIAAQISGYDALLVGLLYALPVGPVTASAEWSWEIETGSGAPSALESPMRIRLAAQMKVGQRLLPGVELGVSPSARPPPTQLARIEPRLWFALTCGFDFARAQREVAPPVEDTTSLHGVTAEPSLLEVKVLDPSGAPVADATLQLAVGSEREEATTDDDGSAVLALHADQKHALNVSGAGFQPRSVAVQANPGRQKVTVSLARALPEGEIKGNVRSLRGGQPVKARITVEPLGTVVTTDEKGNFVVDVPPGPYSLQIEAPGYEPQKRAAQVERRGVTIIVVDLRRATK